MRREQYGGGVWAACLECELDALQRRAAPEPGVTRTVLELGECAGCGRTIHTLRWDRDERGGRKATTTTGQWLGRAPTIHGELYCSGRCRKRIQRGTDYSTDAVCEQCGDYFTRQRSTARFCSTRCRVAAHRASDG